MAVVAVGFGAFLAGAGAGAWASPDTGPGAAVLSAWGAVTGSSRIAADAGATSGTDLADASAADDWFGDRTGAPSTSRSLVGSRGTVPDWADGTDEVVAAPVTA
ncbi:hypothetical protein BH11ACT1_BH11ACT1_31830 [soil metagenome]